MARLRFYARGTAQVSDVHAQEHPTHPVRRFIGRHLQEVLPGRWSWVPKDTPDETPYHPDLAKACRDGHLWPADEYTAKMCSNSEVKVAFDPNFGGELTETIKAFKAKKAAAEAEPKAEETIKPAAGRKGDG